jgi:hypothetical protein
MNEKSETTITTTRVWVLAYILRFSGEPGEWAQVAQQAFTTEEAARAHNASLGGGYQVCSVVVPANV